MDISEYKQQLTQINNALAVCPEDQKAELLILKENIEELISLTNDAEQNDNSNEDPISDEYALFMAEMVKEGAVEPSEQEKLREEIAQLKSIEGKKFRAPHKHNWGQVVYHNAMVCSVLSDNLNSEDIEVRVLFLNPTHQEMLPCPYYFDVDRDCKFTDEKCRFSHGETVLYSTLQEYIEPQFNLLTIGSSILAKQSDNLWYRAKIKHIYDGKCSIRFESKGRNDDEVVFEHIFPIENGNDDQCSEDDFEEIRAENDEDVINISLTNTPQDQALGDWEKYTKGIGSKLMQKMGYIVGTGLGKDCRGRIDPVTAVVLPPGKSLDHCMKLREKYGGDKNLFSAERKLKRLQKKQEKQSQKAYERAANKKDVFSFINTTLSNGEKSEVDEVTQRREYRQSIKEKTEKNLNVAGLVLQENIKKCERCIEQCKESLRRHSNKNSQTHKTLVDKLTLKNDQLKVMKAQASSIMNEQTLRQNKKKMTIF